MAAANSPNTNIEPEDIGSTANWDQVHSNLTPDENVSWKNQMKEDNVSEIMTLVGFDWNLAEDLSNYASSYIDEREESDGREFNDAYGIFDEKELMNEIREYSERLQESLDQSMTYLGKYNEAKKRNGGDIRDASLQTIKEIRKYKEKAEEEVIDVLHAYDDLRQAQSKMEADVEEGQRVVESDEAYNYIRESVEEDLERVVKIFVDEVESYVSARDRIEPHEFNVTYENEAKIK